MYSPFKKPMQQRVVNKENCKIKIKRLPNGGKEIQFSGNCSKEQLEMAKMSDFVSQSEEEE